MLVSSISWRHLRFLCVLKTSQFNLNCYQLRTLDVVNLSSQFDQIYRFQTRSDPTNAFKTHNYFKLSLGSLTITPLRRANARRCNTSPVTSPQLSGFLTVCLVSLLFPIKLLSNFEWSLLNTLGIHRDNFHVTLLLLYYFRIIAFIEFFIMMDCVRQIMST